MDPKYEFRYTANATNAARAASLTGRGALNIMQSHWMVQTIPGLFAAQLATAAPWSTTPDRLLGRRMDVLQINPTVGVAR